MALGRAGDGHDAGRPPEARAPRSRAQAASRLGRCEARAGVGLDDVPKDEPARSGLLRLAGRGPRRDWPRGAQASRAAHLARADQRAAELAARAELIARHTRSGVTGMSRWRTPSGASASLTAFISAGSAPTVPASPTPFAPSGLTLVRTSCESTVKSGKSSARGMV